MKEDIEPIQTREKEFAHAFAFELFTGLKKRISVHLPTAVQGGRILAIFITSFNISEKFQVLILAVNCSKWRVAADSFGGGGGRCQQLLLALSSWESPRGVVTSGAPET